MARIEKLVDLPPVQFRDQIIIDGQPRKSYRDTRTNEIYLVAGLSGPERRRQLDLHEEAIREEARLRDMLLPRALVPLIP